MNGGQPCVTSFSIAEGAGLAGVASSGQICCQSFGRRSRRVTCPPVARSMAVQYSAFSTVPRLRQLLKVV